MRLKFLLISCFFIALIFGNFKHSGAALADTSHKRMSADATIALYGDLIVFDVYRKGKKIGAHHVQFTKQDQRLFVHSTLNLDIRILFFSAYSFSYDSRAIWAGGNLENIIVKVDDGGDKFELTAHRDGDRLQVTHTNGTYETFTPLYPTNHWNSQVLTQDRVLNTLTGKMNNVVISSDREENVETEIGDILAQHFTYAGDLENEVWYDNEGRWVKMRFNGKDGTPIEYVCRRCQGLQAPKVTN